ncbi:MAG: 1,4-alpha-glucan branching protein GlgB [Rhodocyclaceae bacterium]|nr:1,4-alpha-glucan branching protein GlgB [Rhodocyclaceae bacterium]
MHTDVSGRLWLRAFLPHASSVVVVDAVSGKHLTNLLPRHPDGFFEAVIPRRRNRFDYRLQVEWKDGATSLMADAYAFDSDISNEDLYFFGEGTHLRPFRLLGAHPQLRQTGKLRVEGVRFTVWAPGARRVSVVGDFNVWDGRRHVMRRCGTDGGSGVWEIFIPHAAVGDRYKYEIVGRDGKVLPLKADPYARQSELRPGTASIVARSPEASWLPTGREWTNSRAAPVSIYEVHLASWRRPTGAFPTWDFLAETLPAYAKELGFTHVELLPVSEHPLDGSWGYQTLGMYSPTARFGDNAGFQRFIDACHDRNLGVIIDWVPAHFPADEHGLAQFDGTPLYEYTDPKEGFHQDWNTLIYNFDRREVRAFLAGSALYWVEQFGIDGLRVDAVASMLYRDYSRPVGQWIPNVHGGRENLEAISLMKRINEAVGKNCPGVMTVAEESTAFPGVTAPNYTGGLGFHFKWNMGWMNDTLRYMQEDPINRAWHHDKMTFGLVYAFSENFVLPLSHDEVVHGKGALLAKMPGDQWQRFANLRAYYGFMWGHPGKKLLFMGQEFAQPREWNHDVELPWTLCEDAQHSGVKNLVRDLNLVYTEHAALHRLDCEPSGFEWIVADDREQSVFAWLRRDDHGNAVLVVCNFTPIPRPQYRIGVPSAGTYWHTLVDTDSLAYGGSDYRKSAKPFLSEPTKSHHQPASIVIDLPPLATIFLCPNADAVTT